MWKHNVIHKTVTTQLVAMPPAKDRATAGVDKHMELGKVWTCGYASGHGQTDRQTDAYRNTPLSYRRRSNSTTKQRLTNLCWASSLGSQRDATRICCWAFLQLVRSAGARSYRLLSPAGRALSSKPTGRRCCRQPPLLLSIDGTDRRTDRHTDPAPAASSISVMLFWQPFECLFHYNYRVMCNLEK